MKHFLKRLAGFSLGPFIGAAISFILFPIFTNLLPVEEYGLGGGFQTILLQVPNFIYIGMDQAFTREYHHQENQRNLMQKAMLMPFLLGIFLSIIALILSPQLANWFFEDAGYYYIIFFAAIWVLTTIVERFILLSIRMQEKAIEYSLFTALLKVGNFVVSMSMVLFGVRNFTVIVYGLIFGHIGANLLLFFRYRQLLDFSGFTIDKAMIKQMFIFGMPIMVATSLSALLNSIDIIFLTEFSNNHNTGIYKAGSQVGAIIGIMKTAFASFWVPTAYRWYEEKRSMKHYKYVSDMVLFVLSGLFFVLVLLKYPIALFLNPEGDYLDVQYIIGLLAFPHIMYTLSETTTLGIVFSRKTHYNIIVSFLSLAVSLLINISLTPVWGFRGAALASTGAYTVFYLARTYFSSKTGFYFSQFKQIITMILIIIAGLINLFSIDNAFIYTLILGIIALLVQLSTLRTTLEIKNNGSDWNFS